MLLRFMLSTLITILITLYVLHSIHEKRMPVLKQLANKMKQITEKSIVDNGIKNASVSYTILYNHMPFQPHVLRFTIKDGFKRSKEPRLLIDRRDKNIHAMFYIPDEFQYQPMIDSFLKSGWQ